MDEKAFELVFVLLVGVLIGVCIIGFLMQGFLTDCRAELGGYREAMLEDRDIMFCDFDWGIRFDYSKSKCLEESGTIHYYDEPRAEEEPPQDVS